MKQDSPTPVLPWKTNLALTVLASPSIRLFLGRAALVHLYENVALQPRPIAFRLLASLGEDHDVVFTWYALDLLLTVPDEVFQDKWVAVASLPVDNIPGKTIREKVALSQRVITQLFGLWKLAGKAAKLPIRWHDPAHWRLPR
jgi:hypothetical protein